MGPHIGESFGIDLDAPDIVYSLVLDCDLCTHPTSLAQFDFSRDYSRERSEVSLREQLEGKEGSMNAMVREAIDEWIAKRTSTK